MKTLFVVLGFITAILSAVLAVTPLFKIAYFPCLAALVFASVALYLSKRKQLSKKSVHLVFLLTVMALTVTTYKAIFTKVKVSNTEDLIQKEDASKQDAMETLEDIEIDE